MRISTLTLSSPGFPLSFAPSRLGEPRTPHGSSLNIYASLSGTYWSSVATPTTSHPHSPRGIGRAQTRLPTNRRGSTACERFDLTVKHCRNSSPMSRPTCWLRFHTARDRPYSVSVSWSRNTILIIWDSWYCSEGFLTSGRKMETGRSRSEPYLDGASPRTPPERLWGPNAPRRARGARIVARPGLYFPHAARRWDRAGCGKRPPA